MHFCIGKYQSVPRLLAIIVVTSGTLFKHKDIHKVTWRSPNHNTVTQIDHVIINQKSRSCLHNVKVRRGADVGSDHMLVMATLSLKLRRARKREERQLRFDVGKLRNPDVKKTFKLEVKNRFSILQDEQELKIDSFNQALTEASKKILGYRRKTNKDWISLDTWGIIDKWRKKRSCRKPNHNT